MIAAPAVDLKGGRCVQLVGGRPEDVRVSLPDPVAVARHWASLGFGSLHVVDLDAALGGGDNRAVVARVATATGAVTQVGGGVRDERRLRELLAGGADRVVVGTRAVDDPSWLREVAYRHPDRIVVAADIREGRVLRRGWTEESGTEVASLLAAVADIPLAGVLCTDVAREGRMEGIDLASMADIVDRSAHPVWISGGITTLEDLAALDELGAHGVVLGMALYTGTLDPATVAERYGG